MQGYSQRKVLRAQKDCLYKLTPEEKGYLVPFIFGLQNTINVGMDDGVMAGLRFKGITYLAASVGDMLHGFAFNLQPWAREYLENNKNLLEGHEGQPMTPPAKITLKTFKLVNINKYINSQNVFWEIAKISESSQPY